MELSFEGIKNIRDLGGIRTGGRVVKSGLLLRSARLSEATEDDVSRLRQMDLRHIIDFRDTMECDEKPDVSVPGAQYHHLPALRPRSGRIGPQIRSLTAPEVAEKFRHIYRHMAQGDNAAKAYSEFFRIIRGADGAVLWHCTQGKDRTGIATMLLLTALGADEETIREEYFLSNVHMQKVYDDMESAGESRSMLDAARQYLFVQEEFLDVYLETMREEHGGMIGFLQRVLGLADGDIVFLRKKYTLPPGR